MKLLHVSDLHLDTPFTGIGKKDKELQKKLTQAPYEAFDACIDLAIEEDVDIIVISGDLYNSDRQTISAQHYFYTKMEQLQSYQIPVVICHGNHDFIRSDKRMVDYPENIYVFENETVDFFDIELKTNETVRVYGFSYCHRWIRKDMGQDFPRNPMQTDYTIGVLHGQPLSNQAKENNYAPFKISDLSNKGYDYWALGHIHKHQIMNQEPLMLYPGNIQGQHRNEKGDRGCVIVNLSKSQANDFTYHSLSPIIWETEEIDLHSEIQGTDLVKSIQQVIDNYREESLGKGKSYIIDIQLNRSHLISQELYQQIEAGQLYEAINEYISDENFVIINSIQLIMDQTINVFEFDQELKKSFAYISKNYFKEAYDEELLKDLYNHPVLAKHFNLKNSQEFKSAALQEAKNLIIYRADLKLEDEGDNDDH